jgi:hypothetical protein
MDEDKAKNILIYRFVWDYIYMHELVSNFRCVLDLLVIRPAVTVIRCGHRMQGGRAIKCNVAMTASLHIYRLGR